MAAYSITEMVQGAMTMTNPTPFSELNAVLSEWLTGVRAVLGADLTAAYLQGSFAVGDFDADSDVDFLVAIRAELTDVQLSGLQSLHAQIYDLHSPWAKHLEGSYFLEAALRRCGPADPQPWYLDNTSKVLIRSGHDNSLVIRWITRECGIVLAGPDPKMLIDPVPTDDLRREVLRTMREWAEEIFEGRFSIDNRWAQPYVVLSYCRMLHTLHTGAVASKLAGARWAKEALDSRWVGLIDHAWNERPNPSLKVRQPADPGDVSLTLEFIRYTLEAAQQYTKPFWG